MGIRLLFICLLLGAPMNLVGADIDSFHSRVFATDVGCNASFPEYSFKVTSEYSIGNTFLLLQAGRLTHEKPTLIIDQLEQWGFDSVEFIGEGNSRVAGYFARHQDFDLMVMRGTDTVFEAVMDGIFAQLPSRLIGFRGLTHSGFATLYKRYQPRIKKLLKKAQEDGPEKPIVMAGHSLGGVLARFAALDAAKINMNVEAAYVMGSPRIGNDDFYRYFDQNRNFPVYLTSHKKDLTPHLPPTKANFSYFANLFGEIVPQLETFVGSAVRWLNYDSHVVQGVYAFDENGLEKLIGDIPSEQYYWQNLSRQLTESPWTEWPMIISQHSADVHDPDRYLCALSGFSRG